jgi:hypothetical protein
MRANRIDGHDQIVWQRGNRVMGWRRACGVCKRKPTLQRGQNWLCIHLVLAPFACTTTAKLDRPHPART